MTNLSIIQTLAVYLIPLIFAITLHEAAHAYIAFRLGDNTAKLLGRLSFNPSRHVELFGTLIFPLLSIILGSISGGLGFIFGWAKPVPINYAKLKDPKHNLRYIAAAGPVANLVMALMWALAIKASTFCNSYFGIPLNLMGQAGVSINVSLFILNLLPVLPLDGGRIVFSILPPKQAQSFAKTEKYGMWVLIILLLLGGLNLIIQPIYAVLIRTIFSLIQ